MNKKPTQPHSSIFRIGLISVFCCSMLTVSTEAARADVIAQTANGQVRSDIIVHGKVSDKSGPVPGVTITLKNNTKVAVSSDANGNYSIKVPENAILIFQSVGYNTLEVPVNGKTLINVTLNEGISNLDEVVVVGYTTKSLSQLSSSVAVVSGEKLRDVTSNDVTSMLQGKAAGVIVSASSGSPNAEPSIIVRGSSSITAGAGPLYVVDGIIGGTANPSDVESVTILKDAAATGLYGSRASNGVIIITTKTGKPGNNQVNFSATTGLNTASMGNFDVMDSQQLYDYQQTFFDPAIFARDRPASLLQTNTDWRSLAFQTGVTQNYTLSVSGGSEKTQVYISGNYYNEDGTLRTTGRESYNLRTNVSHSISSKLKLGVRLDASYRKWQDDASGN